MNTLEFTDEVTTDKTSRRIDAQWWYLANEKFSPVCQSVSTGGCGSLPTHSAMMIHLLLMSTAERNQLHGQFAEWAENRITQKWEEGSDKDRTYHRNRNGLAKWYRDTNRSFPIYPFVYRELDRQFGMKAVRRIWASAAAWSFHQLPEAQQRSLAKYAELRDAQQRVIDAEAVEALNLILVQ